MRVFLPHWLHQEMEKSICNRFGLTVEDDNPNSASIRFLIDGADIDDPSSYERIVYMFDGHDNASVEHARERWKFHKDSDKRT